MTHTQKRKIVVSEVEYEWCIRGDALYAGHIAVYKPGINGTAIHLDIIPWGVEIRPRTVAEVIKFSLASNWEPNSNGQPFRVGFINESFVELPEGVSNSLEYEAALNRVRAGI